MAYPEENFGGDSAPTEKQKRYLQRLAKKAGREVDVDTLTKREASRLIDELSGNGGGERETADNGYNDGNRNSAFGLATKLVYQRYLNTGAAPQINEEFWSKVRELFHAMEREQQAALNSPQ